MMSTLLEGLNSKIALLGAAAAGLVTLNGAVTSCTSENINRHAAFRTTLTAEESYWKTLYSEWAELASEENKELRYRRAFALSAMSDKDISSYNEFAVALFDDPTARTDAQKRFRKLQSTLQQALTNEAISGPEVASAVRQLIASKQDDLETTEAESQRDTSNQVQTSPVAIQTASAVAPELKSIVRSNGSAKGWDIDIFWCVVSDNGTLNQANYDAARASAEKLANRATARRPLDNNTLLGRVRIRPLPELRQGNGYPVSGSGFSIRPEKDVGEIEAANSVVKFLNTQNRQFSTTHSAMSTSYYLSIFVCQSSAQPLLS